MRILAFVAVCCVAISLGGCIREPVCPPCEVRVYANRGPERAGLESVIIDLIESVPGGESIDVMVAWVKLESIAGALVDATDRDVSVRVLVRETGDCTWLEGMGIDARRLTTLHHKVAVFPEVVLTGSANWTETSFDKDWNDIAVIHNPYIRSFYLALFEDAWGSVPCCGN